MQLLDIQNTLLTLQHLDEQHLAQIVQEQLPALVAHLRHKKWNLTLAARRRAIDPRDAARQMDEIIEATRRVTHPLLLPARDLLLAYLEPAVPHGDVFTRLDEIVDLHKTSEWESKRPFIGK